MSLVQENPLWGPGEAVGIRWGWFSQLRTGGRGWHQEQEGDRSGWGKELAPTSSTPTPGHPGSCPAPEPGPALESLKGGGRGRKRS